MLKPNVFYAKIFFTILISLPGIPKTLAATTQEIACPPFANAPVSAPIPREDSRASERLTAINASVKEKNYNVIFFGDSLTERWIPNLWDKYLSAFNTLNAGIDGDRTEHLLWRLDHGNLDGHAPNVVVLLIGTNDLGHGRSPEITAAGIRANLMRLRERWPGSRILLLGLLPRTDRFGGQIDAVNRLIATCNGGAITYADIGRSLLDQIRKRQKVLIDGVHLTELGYEKISRLIKILLSTLVDH